MWKQETKEMGRCQATGFGDGGDHEAGKWAGLRMGRTREQGSKNLQKGTKL
jgi:hypothetical protein